LRWSATNADLLKEINVIQNHGRLDRGETGEFPNCQISGGIRGGVLGRHAVEVEVVWGG